MTDENVRKLCLEILAPVHLGCDEVYDPTGFSLNESAKSLLVFDPLEFIRELNGKDQARFTQLCTQGTLESIRSIYRFMQNRAVTGRSVALCRGFLDHYRNLLQMPKNLLKKELNRFEIGRTAYCPMDQRPYIPGSAVKGALRTAVLNSLAARKNIATPSGWSAAKQLEENLLDLHRARPKEKFSLDPFRLVKVSDFMPVSNIETKVIYMINQRKRPTGGLGRGPYQIVEVVLPGARFLGEVSITPPQKADAVSMRLRLPDVLAAANEFYGGEKEREETELNRLGIAGIEDPEAGPAALLRIGRHSGAECVTISGHRRIKIMLERGASHLIEDHATTLWLASEQSKPQPTDLLKSCGWTALRAVTDGELKTYEQMERQYAQKSRRSAAAETTVAAAAAKNALEKPLPPPKPQRRTWTSPILTWAPGKGEITAVCETGKAFASGKDLVPQSYHKKLFGKKKRVTAQTVEVEAVGNAWKIVTII